MKLNIEEKIDLLLCVCSSLANEKERYSIIKDMSEEELQQFYKEFGIKIKPDRDAMKNNIDRLEKLRDKLKKETE